MERCAHCGFRKSDFVLTLDDIICADCADDSHHTDRKSVIVRHLELSELSVCSICECAYIKHEGEEHDLCSIICFQTLWNREK